MMKRNLLCSCLLLLSSCFSAVFSQALLVSHPDSLVGTTVIATPQGTLLEVNHHPVIAAAFFLYKNPDSSTTIRLTITTWAGAGQDLVVDETEKGGCDLKTVTGITVEGKYLGIIRVGLPSKDISETHFQLSWSDIFILADQPVTSMQYGIAGVSRIRLELDAKGKKQLQKMAKLFLTAKE